MDIRYCPNCGFDHLQELNGSLYEPCTVCVNCKTVFINKLIEVPRQELNNSYNTDRHDQIIKTANIMFGKSRVKKEQLVKLGIIDKNGNLK